MEVAGGLLKVNIEVQKLLYKGVTLCDKLKSNIFLQ